MAGILFEVRSQRHRQPHWGAYILFPILHNVISVSEIKKIKDPEKMPYHPHQTEPGLANNALRTSNITYP